jgi:hypothetical protein
MSIKIYKSTYKNKKAITLENRKLSQNLGEKWLLLNTIGIFFFSYNYLHIME